MRQFPDAFEFSDAYLQELGDHLYSCRFGTFLCDSERDRVKWDVRRQTQSVWTHLCDDDNDVFVNPHYCPTKQSPHASVLIPCVSARRIVLWEARYLRWWDNTRHSHGTARFAAPPAAPFAALEHGSAPESLNYAALRAWAQQKGLDLAAFDKERGVEGSGDDDNRTQAPSRSHRPNVQAWDSPFVRDPYAGLDASGDFTPQKGGGKDADLKHQSRTVVAGVNLDLQLIENYSAAPTVPAGINITDYFAKPGSESPIGASPPDSP